MDANGVRVADDVARGNGETIAALSQLMGCQNPAAVKSVLKDNFNKIFSSPSVTSKEMSTELMTTIKTDARTAGSCDLA